MRTNPTLTHEGIPVVAVSRTVTVPASMEQVQEYLKDFSNAEQWDPGTLQCVRCDEGPVRVGSEWINTSSFMGRTAVLRYRLVVLERNQLVFRGANDKAKSEDDMVFEPVSLGTRITYNARITFGGVVKLAAPLLRRPFERLADNVAERMTEVLSEL